MAFFGEIRMFSGPLSTLPTGWALCDGSLISLTDGGGEVANAIGATYGFGSLFKLPDLRSRAPVHAQPGRLALALNIYDGVETVSIPPGQLPSHSHDAGCSTSSTNSSDPTGAVLGAAGGGVNVYNPLLAGASTYSLNRSTISPAGLSSPHSNLQPYIAVNYIICISGGSPPA